MMSSISKDNGNNVDVHHHRRYPQSQQLSSQFLDPSSSDTKSFQFHTTPKQRRAAQLKTANNLGESTSSDSSDCDSMTQDRYPMISLRHPILMEDTTNVHSNMQNHSSERMVRALYYVSQIVGFFLFFSILFWTINYLDGFGFSKPIIIFNFHPFFMFFGFIWIGSNAMLIYRTIPWSSKKKLKITHTVLNFLAIFFSTFGSFAAIYFHEKANLSHFYSLHSWLGICTWILFCSQFLSGFIVFLFPGAAPKIRKNLMNYHRFFGIAIFILAVATCITGFNEKAIFAFKNPPYSAKSSNGITTNIIAILMVFYSALIVYLGTKSEYQRKETTSESRTNYDLALSN